MLLRNVACSWDLRKNGKLHSCRRCVFVLETKGSLQTISLLLIMCVRENHSLLRACICVLIRQSTELIVFNCVSVDQLIILKSFNFSLYESCIKELTLTHSDSSTQICSGSHTCRTSIDTLMPTHRWNCSNLFQFSLQLLTIPV